LRVYFVLVIAAFEISNIVVSAKLDGSNYASWKCEMELILQMKILWELTTEDKLEDESKHEKWNKMDMNARAPILWQINLGIRSHVRDLKTTKKIWETLQTMYERTSKLKVMDIKRQLTHFKMKGGDSMNEHIVKLKNLRNQLAMVKVKYEDSEIIDFLIESLPNEYHNFIYTLELTGKFEDITLEEVYGTLLNEEERLKKFTGESSKSSQAFMARGKYKNYIQNKSYQNPGNQHRNNQKQWNQPKDNQQRNGFQKAQNREIT
jgi:hypothetical protein